MAGASVQKCPTRAAINRRADLVLNLQAFSSMGRTEKLRGTFKPPLGPLDASDDG